MSMTFFKSHQKLHIWLLADLVLLAAFWIAREHRDWMNALERFVSAPIRRSLGSLCYRVSFSVMEVLYVLAAVLALAYVVWNITAVVRARGRRKRRAYSAVLGAVCAGLSVCAATCLLWGVCYYTDTFQDRSGIRAEEVSLPDLTAVTAWFAENLAQTADQVPRDEAGTFNASLNEIFAGSTDIYQGAEDLFPFLEFEDRAPKRMFFSRVMSAMNFTGVYFAFTGESNINVDAPACLIPSTIAHELSHQRGIASEQECNFLAVLASTTSGDPVYEYSGWLMGYIHLGNALYQADPAAWQAIRDSLPDTVLADLASNNAYWASFEGAAADASQKVYDTILKGYGQEDGIRSYGTVVDLLVAYYRDTARTNGSEGLTT
ncbi:hypothetical protein K430107D3_01380 [Dysosmobacter welbionis]